VTQFVPEGIRVSLDFGGRSQEMGDQLY